jgi:hypothetical protein
MIRALFAASFLFLAGCGPELPTKDPKPKTSTTAKTAGPKNKNGPTNPHFFGTEGAKNIHSAFSAFGLN